LTLLHFRAESKVSCKHGLLEPEHVPGRQTNPAEGAALHLHPVEARWELCGIMRFPELISVLWSSPWAEAGAPGSTGHAHPSAVLSPPMCPSHRTPQHWASCDQEFSLKTGSQDLAGWCWACLRAQLGGQQPW